MKFGFVLPNHLGVEDPADIVSVGVHAENAGFDSVWVNHHVVNAGYVRDRLGDQPYHDALVLLTWLASKTHYVRIGTSVLVLPYLHPMVLARELATLDHLSEGRLVVGVGVGSLPSENAALGVPYKTRGAYSNEFIEVLKSLWTEGEASYEGEYFEFEDVISSPKPLQRPHPPIMVGGNHRVALRRVATHGDGWHPLMLTPDGVRERLESLRGEAEGVGRKEGLGKVLVRLDMANVTPGTVADYEAAGATELVLSFSNPDVQEARAEIDRFAAAMF
ncbi:MAG: TIGR03619 family F420-dependent LLM class oxidoreductase [bacterium]|nr:TIGR03619 family F420-dependent LLM class oxidoreductase [bacterium]